MIKISGLTKRFGPITAVAGLDLTVERGEVLGFLGPNGAGKSTTMRMVTGFVVPTAGTVTVAGHDVGEDPIAAQRVIGYMPEGAPLYEDITPVAFLDFIAAVRGYDGAERKERVARAIRLLDLADVAHRPIGTLSKGYKRRTGLAQAVLHDPDVLILDEPTDGLDPNQKHHVRSLIRAMGRDKAIIISTHILEEVEAVCTRAVIIAQGRLVFDGTPVALKGRSLSHNAVTIRVKRDAAAQALTNLATVAGVARVVEKPATNGIATLVAFPVDGKSIIQDVSDRLRRDGCPIEGLTVDSGELDEVFRRLTTTV